jgi:quercetin dioxygenase-like cupin family protein
MYENVEKFPAGTTVSWLQSVYSILITPAETHGALGMFSAVVKPQSGPARHVHHNEDEIIHIVEGEVLFWLEGETFLRRAGDTVMVPRGKQHAFLVTSNDAARFVTCVTPGGFEGFFASVTKQGLQFPQHKAAVDAMAAAFGCEFTGPPLQVPSVDVRHMVGNARSFAEAATAPARA